MTETTMHPGTLLDTPEKRAEAERLGRAATCPGCGRGYYQARPEAATCWGCWYSLEMQTSENGFKPLSMWLERLLETETSVDQTGGMVMCLRVPIGRDVDVRGDGRRYVYFSETIGDPSGFGYYEHDEQGEMIGNGDMHYWPMEFECAGPECGWYHHPDFAEAVARWAAPIIVGLAAGVRP